MLGSSTAERARGGGTVDLAGWLAGWLAGRGRVSLESARFAAINRLLNQEGLDSADTGGVLTPAKKGPC